MITTDETKPLLASDKPPQIVQPYLNVTLCLPIYRDAEGGRWIDELWARDLVSHTDYIDDLSILSVSVRDSPPSNFACIDTNPKLRSVRFIEVPRFKNTIHAFLLLPYVWSILWREIGRAKFVHTGVAGWPLPEAWIVAPIAWVRRRPLLTMVESAFWRLSPGGSHGFRRRFRARITEILNRFCIERSDISIFTQEGYRKSLLRRHTSRGHVIEASWIDLASVLSDAQAIHDMERRRKPGKLRTVFAGRLTAEKGLPTLLDAIGMCTRAGIEIELDIFGSGPLQQEYAQRIKHEGLGSHVRLMGLVQYGEPFLSTIRGYDAMIVPSLSDEQPRVIFDAFSQGLPVIASRTSGHLQCITAGLTGFLFDIGSSAALSKILATLAQDRVELTSVSKACLARAREVTHQHMHLSRWCLIVSSFPSLAEPARSSRHQ